MTTKTNTSKGIQTVLAAACLAAAGANVAVIVLNQVLSSVLGAVLGLFGCFAAMYYAWRGCSKNAAICYKIYMLIAVVSYQLASSALGIHLNGVAAGVSVGLYTLGAGCALALALGTDLGKKTSMILCWIIIAVTAALMCTAAIVLPGAVRGGSVMGTIALSRAGSNFFLAVVAMAMTAAKYQDKAARGTK